MNEIDIIPPSGWSYLADACMKPIMLLVSGALKEAPQETHFWNNHKLPAELLAWLWREKMVKVVGIPDVPPAYLGPVPRMHLPIFGGWKDYVALEVTKDIPWYVGWRTARVCGISRIPVTGHRIRCLVGGEDTEFFALTAAGHQLTVRLLLRGIVGDGGPFCQVPLR